VKASGYVDGFDLYYGLKYHQQYGKHYKWPDLAALCRLELPRHTVTRIRYFTALVKPHPNNPQQAQRQQVYIRALETIPGLTVHYGRFLDSEAWMPVAGSPPNTARKVRVTKTEEKGSDVNLASMLLCDGFDDDYDLAVILSNDSDLSMPIELVRRKLRKGAGVLSPNRRYGSELRRVATFFQPIREASFAASQFPPTLTDANGTITKPRGW